MPMRYLRYSRRSAPASVPATGWAILRIVLTLAGTLLALSVVVFVLTAAPADPARAYLGTSASPAQLAIFRHAYGLDHSLARRYLDWLSPSNGSHDRNRTRAGTRSRCGQRRSNSVWFSAVAPSHTFRHGHA